MAGGIEDLVRTLKEKMNLQTFGAEIATVITAPPKVTLKVEGMQEALPLSFFRVPVSCFPLRPGDQLVVVPLRALTDTLYIAFNKLGAGPGVTGTLASTAPTIQVTGSSEILTAAQLTVLNGITTGDPDLGKTYALLAYLGNGSDPASIKYFVANKV